LVAAPSATSLRPSRCCARRKYSSPGTQAHFVCSTRPEDGKFLEKENIPFTALAGRVIPLWQMPAAFVRAWSLLRKVKPDVVFTKGGGVTIPVTLAAKLSGIPIIVHESDVVPGKATTFIAKFADTVCYGFPDKVDGNLMHCVSAIAKSPPCIPAILSVPTFIPVPASAALR